MQINVETTKPKGTPPEELKRQFKMFSDVPFFRDIQNASARPIIILNKDNRIVFANLSLLKSFGHEALEDVLGLRMGELFNCSHSIEPPGGCGTTRYCSNCSVFRSLLEIEGGAEASKDVMLLDTRGTPLDLRINVTPFLMENEPFVLMKIIDISHENRRRALEQIFFHDILNRAGAINNSIKMLQYPKVTEDPETRERLIKIINESSPLLTHEILAQRDLLSAERRDLRVHSVPLTPSAILESVANYIKILCPNRKLEVKTCDAEEAGDFRSDKVLLERVLINLMKNACEASKLEETLTFGCQIEGDKINFKVGNPGVIPEKVKLNIFLRSFSTKGKGRGLGTYSAKLLTEQYLGGRIFFTSTPEKGTTFTVELPIEGP